MYNYWDVASKLNTAVVLGLDLWAVLGLDLIELVCDAMWCNIGINNSKILSASLFIKTYFLSVSYSPSSVNSNVGTPNVELNTNFVVVFYEMWRYSN